MPLSRSEFHTKITSWGRITYTHVVVREHINNSDALHRFDIYVRDGIKNCAHLHVYTTEHGEKPDEMRRQIEKWLRSFNVRQKLMT